MSEKDKGCCNIELKGHQMLPESERKSVPIPISFQADRVEADLRRKSSGGRQVKQWEKRMTGHINNISRNLPKVLFQDNSNLPSVSSSMFSSMNVSTDQLDFIK